MPNFQLTNGAQFVDNGHAAGIVWLQTGNTITLDFVAPSAGGADNRSVTITSAVPSTVDISDLRKTSTKLTFKLKATGEEVVTVAGKNAAGAIAHQLVIVTGSFQNYPGMDTDLLANICRGSDAAKTLAVQRLLFGQEDNIFNQLNTGNVNKFGRMGCGKVVKASGDALFDKVSPIDYEHPYHEPLDAVADRTDVRYKADTIAAVCGMIQSTLARGIPVRVGVLDSPVGMHVQNHKLIAYFGGGHTTLIVGCNKAATRFLYIDTWPGGSKLTYQGGFKSTTFDASGFMGTYGAMSDDTRLVSAADKGRRNIIRQESATEGSFSTGAGNFLEVVSGPSIARH